MKIFHKIYQGLMHPSRTASPKRPDAVLYLDVPEPGTHSFAIWAYKDHRGVVYNTIISRVEDTNEEQEAA